MDRSGARGGEQHELRFQISSSGLLTALYRQDVYANNMANMDTVGFKPDIPARSCGAMRPEPGSPSVRPVGCHARAAGRGSAAPTRVNLAQGPTKITNSPYDAAIEGNGFSGPGGPKDAGRTALLTRDGRFAARRSPDPRRDRCRRA